MKTSRTKTRKPSKPLDTRRLVVISDLHAGSTYAPCPDGFERHDGNRVTQNVHGKFATEAWSLFVQDVRKLGEFDVLVNGDCIEGMHHRSTEVWSMDPADHARAAVELLGPLLSPARKVWFTRGTDCHTGSSEESIALHFGAEREESGRCAPDLWRFTYCGVRVHAVHHMPTTSRKSLEATQLSIQLAEHQLQSARAGMEIPRLVIASHRHTPGFYSDFHSSMIATPAWQTADGRHTKKVVPASKTRVGGLILSWENADDGELPAVVDRIYQPEAK